MPLKPSPVERDEELDVPEGLEEDEQLEVLWEKPLEHRGTSKKLLPPADIGQAEALKLVGQLLDERHYTLLLDETATVGTPDGGPICVLLKNRIPKDLLDRVRPAIRAAASQAVAGGNRVAAAGAGKGLRLRADGSKSKISGVPRLEDMPDEDYRRLKSARDGTVGFSAGTVRAGQKYPCRQTAWTARAPISQFSAMSKLAEIAAEVWRESILWIQHDIQMEKALKTPPDYILETKKGILPFTTITCNRSWRTAAHVDSGDLKRGFGVMCCLGDFEGCNLVFPRYKVAVRFREGDILLADVANQVHGNTELLNPDGSVPRVEEAPERLSCVFYYQEKMEHCQIPELEMHAINNWKKGQSTRTNKKKRS